MELHQPKKLLHGKGNGRMERQSTKCEEMFVNHVFDKGLISNICKKLIQLSSKKKKKGLKIGPLLPSVNLFLQEEKWHLLQLIHTTQVL